MSSNSSFQVPPQIEKTGGSSSYIVIFILLVVGVAGGLYYQMQKKNAQLKAEMAENEAKSKAIQEEQDALNASKIEIAETEARTKAAAEELKKQEQENAAQAKAAAEELKKQEQENAAKAKAQEEAFKAREEELKRAEAKVQSDLNAAANTIRDAKKLQEEAVSIKADADQKAKEAADAMKKATETNDANLKALAQEKQKIADEAAAKVAAAEAKAAEVTSQAKAEAEKAIELKNRLEAATNKLKGKLYEEAAKYGAVPGILDKPKTLVTSLPSYSKSAEWCKKGARMNEALMWHYDTKNQKCYHYGKDKNYKYEGSPTDETNMTGCAFDGTPNTATGCNSYPETLLYKGDGFDGGAPRIIKGKKSMGTLFLWNNKIKSVRVPKYTRLILYKGGNYSGPKRILDGLLNKKLGSEMSGQVSSLKTEYI